MATLNKINYLTEEQYQKAKAEGNLNENELYMTQSNNTAKSARLFFDIAGTYDSVPLSRSKSEFEKIKIIYVSNGGDWGCVEVPTDRTVVALHVVDNNGSGTNAWIKKTTYDFNDKELTFKACFWKNINGSDLGYENAIKIVEVIGISTNDYAKNDSDEWNNEVYSHQETVIGEYLGKPLYRKVVQITLPTTANSWVTVKTAVISNLDFLVTLRGTFKQGSEFFTVPMGEGQYYVAVKVQENGDIMCNRNGWSAVTANLTLEYTKTTD